MSFCLIKEIQRLLSCDDKTGRCGSRRRPRPRHRPALGLLSHTFYQRQQHHFLHLIHQRSHCAPETFRNKQELILLLTSAVRQFITLLPTNTRVLRVCLQLNTVTDQHELSVTSGFDWHPRAVSTAVVLRVALCGQDCSGLGEQAMEGRFELCCTTLYPETYQTRAKTKKKRGGGFCEAVECVLG